MTLARKTFYLSSSILLAAAMGVAQTAVGGRSQDQDSSMSGQPAGANLRGCLSGSAGNYTLTDHNGAIYHLVGGEAQLQDAVGHEVEVTGTPDAQRTGASDDTAANTASSFQVTGAHEVGARCSHGSPSGSPGDQSQPMNEKPPSTDHQPKGAPGEGAPPQPQPEPHPELMAMLQQQPSSTDNGNEMPQSSNSSNMSSPSTTSSQSSQSAGTGATSTPPPVTSQTPAASQSPTNPNSQLGRGTANQTGTATAPGDTAASSAAGASQSDAGSDVNAASSSSQQSTQNDANKPLYERQATDVPWASHSGSTTTTTTTPQPPPKQ